MTVQLAVHTRGLDAALARAELALEALQAMPNAGAIPQGFVRYVARCYTAHELRQASHVCAVEAYASDFLGEPDAGRWREDATIYYLALCLKESEPLAAVVAPGRPVRRIDYAAIKHDLDIVQYVSYYVSLHRAGRNPRGLCPFHSEKTPSFYVFPDKGNYHCFGCGAHGDVLDFLDAMGVDWRRRA